MLGHVRDAYYKRFARKKDKRISEEKVLELVGLARKDQHRMGTRKLYSTIEPKIKENDIHCGRDRLFSLLRKNDLLIEPKKRFKKTTYSNHEYALASNRIKGLVIDRPNQVFVCDITYVSLKTGFAYLFLVTDAYSRKIVGHHFSRDLSHYSAILALHNALKNVVNTQGIICHSDRGCQYCCHQYIKQLNQYGLISSMTSESHCYQNAIAERVNGILKDEFDIDQTFYSFSHAKLSINHAIKIYNTKRKHWSLNLNTPDFVYANAA